MDSFGSGQDPVAGSYE